MGGAFRKIRLLAALLAVVVASGCYWQRDNPWDHEGVNPPKADRSVDGVLDGPLDAAPDLAPDITPDAPTTCVHPKVVKKCGKGTGNLMWCEIRAGCFAMGTAGTSEEDNCARTWETSKHNVTLTRPFEIAQYEVSQAEYELIKKEKPSFFSACGLDCPVESVNWYEAADFCNKLSEAHKPKLTSCYTCTGSGASLTCSVDAKYSGNKIYTCPGYRLPTEAEWEYAYRGGQATVLYNGKITGGCYEKNTYADEIAWYRHNAKNTQPAGKKKENPWGLYDMAGNVFEWVHDRFQYDLGSGPKTDPVGSGTHGLLRGGAYDMDPDILRGPCRYCVKYPELKDSGGGEPACVELTYQEKNTGFRCARTLTP